MQVAREYSTQEMASVGIKRDRDSLECGREDEPLAKRINNLHLNTGAGTASAPSTSGNGLQHYQCLPLPCAINGIVSSAPSSVSPSNGFLMGHHNHYYPGNVGNIPPTQLPVRELHQHNFQQQTIQQQQHQHHHGTSHHQQQIINQHELIHHQQQQQQQQQLQQQQLQQHNVQSAQSRLEDLVASRELPDSLCLQYPTSNPTHNPHYFNANKVLHHLHIDRLRRSGKID